MATIHDVARHAQVGTGTVSRVLNNHTSVSESTRKRVEEAIVELNYSPHPMARRLSLGKTLTIAVVAPFFTRPSYVERLRGIHTVLAESEYEFVLYNIESPDAWTAYLDKPMGQERHDGLLIMTLRPHSSAIQRLTATGMPIVFVDCDQPGFNRVIVDDVFGGRLATQHLIDLGHRQIAYVGDRVNSEFDFVANNHRFQGLANIQRFQGYQEALAAAHIPFQESYHQQAEHGVREAVIMAHRLLDLPDPPTAVVTASDTQASGVLSAARERGVRVPEDLSVVGYDDIEIAEYLHLTTIRQPLFASGVAGIELLLSMLSGGQPEERCIQQPLELIRRGTTSTPGQPAIR